MPKPSASPLFASPLRIVILAYPGCTLLDLVGPHAALTAVPDADVGLYWKQPGLIATDSGARLFADRAFDDAPDRPDVLLVPGGAESTIALLDDPLTLAWLADLGARAGWVTSVCSGSLLLGAAGLLDGYRATSHWTVCAALALFGATPVAKRVVIDRNRMTGGGVTAGIDFGLTLAAQLADEGTARAIQLAMEYAPAPPFDAGTPERAGPEVVAAVLGGYAMETGLAALTAAAARMPSFRPPMQSKEEMHHATAL